MEYLERIFTSDGGAFGVIVALLLLAFWVVNKISKITANHDSFTGNVNDIKCDVKTINVDIAHLKGSFTAIIAQNNPFTQRQSPVSLTDKGKEIAEELGAEKMISDNWDDIYEKLKSNLHSMNAYDIQQFCIEKGTTDVGFFLKKCDLDKVKTDAYKRGFTLSNYGGLFAVIIRDKYFDVEKISIDDVDKYDPNIPDQ